jgi:DNA-binding Lrp family transcriptional regulator
MDEIDAKIIETMVENSRASLSHIGEDLGISSSTVYKRLKKLEKQGIIKQYTVLLDNEKVGLKITAFVGINCGEESKKKIAKKLEDLKEVVEIHEVLEPYDFLIKVRGPALMTLKKKVLGKIQGFKGILKMDTMLVVGTVKEKCY